MAMNSKSDRKVHAAHARIRGGDFSRHPLVALCAVALLALSGCGKPNQANIQLRKDVAARDAELAILKLEREADRATIKSLQSDGTQPAVANDKLQSLFTTHGIRLGRLTGFAYTDAKSPGPDGIKIYVTPFDSTSDDLKAAGSFTVEAFDLTTSGARIGKWDFSTADAKKLWNGQGLLYEYVLPCKFEGEAPRASELTLKVTFTDELTGRTYTQQQVIKRR